MTDLFSERRLAENEVIFRELNMRIKRTVEKNLHGQTGDLPLEFYCECSNEKCRERVTITAEKFSEAHSSPKRFIIRKGHAQAAIEKVVEASREFDIVEKYLTPPAETDFQLNPT